jgi:thiamine kinase-like enzyme
VTGAEGDFAVKFTIRDERDRAGREYYTLLALSQAGFQLAPEPLLIDRNRFAQPVVVMSWLPGDVSEAVPQTDVDWSKLVEHLLTIHRFKPIQTALPLRSAVLTAYSVESGREIIRRELERLPSAELPAALKLLVRQLELTHFPEWDYAPLALCRVDANILNFVRRPGAWVSVDWENSGWGDPAFEIADLMSHPAYFSVTPERWAWVIDCYSAVSDDRTIATRIQVYHCLMMTWWVVRLARLLYEVPRGLDQRLVARSTDWQSETEIKYQRYLNRAAL